VDIAVNALLLKNSQKSKKTKNVFDNCELAAISKARIPPCGVLDYKPKK
jgi:hypothetical protein